MGSLECSINNGEGAFDSPPELSAGSVTPVDVAAPSSMICGICMELKKTTETFQSGPCLHRFCRDCICNYIALKVKDEGVSTCRCPEPGCGGTIDAYRCREILPANVFERWSALIAESLVCSENVFYCPYRDCSAPMERCGEPVISIAECPHCRRLLCASCDVAPWHKDVSCEEFRRLETGDVALLKLAEDCSWKRCPGCKFYVEKVDGCLHMKCRKALVAIADEDGNYLEESWEHILTCVSRFEHLHLLGEVAPPDATLSVASQIDLDKSKQSKSVVLPVLKNEPGRHPNASTAVRRGSYDSAVVGGDAFGAVTNEQMNKLVSNLNLLGKVGEMNWIFVRSQQLNGEAIVDFVKSLCKVSMDELRSTSSPGVFSLTKIIEIAHYNMNRIKLVWSGIWKVLADYFVNIGCSENLPIAIFAMDSLRQLAMKFLEREELANYNFQNEFMKPFVVVMRKSSSVEIRELIIRCVSQMVFTRINNIKSGWKSMFMVFTTAAYDGHKNIVNLAFEIIEKIVRGYFSHITETETAFTNCVNCLVVFTNSRLNNDISFNAIAILHFCAAKLSEGDARHAPSSPHGGKNGNADGPHFTEKDSHLYLWFPLLAGLSELTFDPRMEIREKALQVLFDALKNQGHVFSLALWERVFDSVLFPIFDYVRRAIDPSADILEGRDNLDIDGNDQGQDVRFYETCTPTLRLVVDIFVKFYNTVNPLLKKVLVLLVSFIKLPHQSIAGIGLAALVRLMFRAGDLFSEDNWLEVVLSLKEAFSATLPDFSRFLTETSGEESSNKRSNGEIPGSAVPDDETESSREESLYLAVADIKCRTAIQLLLIQAIMEIYELHKSRLSTKNTLVLFDALHSAALHAHVINRDTTLRSKIRDLGSVAQIQDPPLLRLEKESYLLCLTLLQDLTFNESIGHGETETEGFLVDLCKEVLHGYLNVAQSFPQVDDVDVPDSPHCLIFFGPVKRKELSARAPLVVSTLQALTRLEESSFEKKLAQFFPLLCSLIRSEHGSGEVQAALCAVLTGWVGPILLRSC